MCYTYELFGLKNNFFDCEENKECLVKQEIKLNRVSNENLTCQKFLASRLIWLSASRIFDKRRKINES